MCTFDFIHTQKKTSHINVKLPDGRKIMKKRGD